MKKKKEQKCFPCDSRNHLQNMVDLLVPFWVAALSFALSVTGGVMLSGDVDPVIAWTPVGLMIPWLASACIAGVARLIEYQRVIRYLRLYGVRSVAFNFRVDALYHQLNSTIGRRKVLASGLTTLRVPMMYAQTMQTFKDKGLPRYLWISWDWWRDTFSPARILT